MGTTVIKGEFTGDMTVAEKIERALNLIRHELHNAMLKHPSRTDSSHHNLAVVEEELHEARLAVYADEFMNAKNEMLQVGAMAVRYIIEAQEDHAKRKNFPTFATAF